MNATTFHRLHNLRMENDAAGYAMAEQAPRFAQMADRHENGTAPRAVVAYQLFQTPASVAAQLATLLALEGGERILEPSAGLGRLLDAVAPFNPSQVVAVELAAACAGELFKQERASTQIKQRDFLTLTPHDLGFFEVIAMNPPFHNRADIKHIEHALTFLRPGGRLAAICFDTEHRRKAFKHRASQWIELDASTFKEAGTAVATVLLAIDKPGLTLAPPESIADQAARQARALAQASQRAHRQTVQDRAAAPLVGTRGDLGQADMLGGSDLWGNAQ